MSQIEQIKAEIESRLEDYSVQTVAGAELSGLLSFIESMEQSIDADKMIGLDEAAEKAAWDWSCENKLDPYSMGQVYGEGFKAGAEWMAGQGVTSETAVKIIDETLKDDDYKAKTIK